MFMEKSYYKILDEIESAGFVAYIVGGYVRDKILGVITADIDIITNATPKDLNGIFKNIKKTYLDYGAVKLYIDNHIIDITTFRREFDYKNNKPSRIEYISSLETDLLRRDFKMNTLVMDKEENIIDLLGGKKDIKDKIITPVKDVNVLFSEDASRMLRALRFMFTLDFTLDKSILDYIISHKKLFKTISNTKKKEEFDKIFKTKNTKDFLEFIKKYQLEEVLGIKSNSNYIITDTVIVTYAQLEIMCELPFTKYEKEQIKQIKSIVNSGKLDKMDIYKNGLYISMCAGKLLGIPKEKINLIYTNLPIKSIIDIDIKSEEVSSVLGIKPGKKLGEVLHILEYEIVSGKLDNKHDLILERLSEFNE